MRITTDGKYTYIMGTGRLLVKVNDFLEKTVARGLSYHTTKSYAYDLKRFLAWIEDQKKFSFKKFTLADLQSWVLDQSREECAPRSINRRLIAVQVFYQFCFDKEMPRGKGALLSNPNYRNARYDHRLGIFQVRARRSLKVKIPKKMILAPRPKEVDAFLSSITRYRDLGIVLIMLLCGLRKQEVISLKNCDIDFEGGKIVVSGKGRRERCVPLPLKLIRVLEQYLYFERPQENSNKNTDDNPFFIVLQGGRKGKSLSPEGVRSLFRYRSKKCQLKNFSAHKLRHAFASDLARSGVSLPTIQKLLGHSDPQTSMIYINLFLDDIEKEYSKALKKIEERYAKV